MVNFRIIVSLVLSLSSCNAESWVSSPQKGWLWYKKSPKKIQEKTKPTGEKQSAITYRDRVKKYKHYIEEVQARAVMAPTLENVLAFQKVQSQALNRAENFEKMWMLASMLSSQGYRESDQPFPQHRKTYAAVREKQLDAQIKHLAQSFGLFFIFKNNCPYCHQFAPILREFIDQYGFNYKAISPDGESLPEFPDAVADNGTIHTVNPEGIYPLVVLVNPQTRQVIPLSRGLVNSDHLKVNLKTILPHLKG